MLDRVQLERWLFGTGPGQRRTQDSPILPEVWYAYALEPDELERTETPLVAVPDHQRGDPGAWEPERSADLLMRPAAESSASELARIMHGRLGRERSDTLLAYNDVYVACKLTFPELLHVALPLTDFWQTRLWPGRTGPVRDELADRIEDVEQLLSPGGARVQGRQALHENDLPGDLVWLIGLVGRIAWEHAEQRDDGPSLPTAGAPLPTAGEVVRAGLELLGDIELGKGSDPTALTAVSRNRPVQTSVWRSRVACKADAATRLFGLSSRDVRWAVIDSGIDARHPAFGRRTEDTSVVTSGDDPAQSASSRIEATWDFATIRQQLAQLPFQQPDPGGPPNARAPDELALNDPATDAAEEFANQVARGRSVDWDVIAPMLAIHHDQTYRPPADDHGTHVAGILAADWRADDAPPSGRQDVQGICPDLRLYDLRAFDEAGTSDEFQILSAMQFVRHLNAHADKPVVHGVNLSFSVRHDVDKYAAGSTPVCEEAHRLIGSGVVVVAAAGNDGRGGYLTEGRAVEGYRSVSITDPGNAEKVITVGATHRDRPHTYGVSYFSSRGPTGDGRAKPDLVAPGETISSVVPGAGLQSKDGTSQATPHVSGACALLMARHPELIGQPERIKEILIKTCTDLGRERAFQGAGMVDILRAIQSV